MLVGSNTSTSNTSVLTPDATSSGAEALFQMALANQTNTPAGGINANASNPNLLAVSPSGLNAPAELVNNLTDLIKQAFAGIPKGTAGIIGTRLNAVPDEVMAILPKSIRDKVPGGSASVALIFPPNTLDILEGNGIGGLGQLLLKTTLWLGIVPESGPLFPAPPGSDRLGANAALVLTGNLNQGLNVDVRAGWAFLNDVRPQIPPIISDKVDPDTWLFLNAGIPGSITNPGELPQVLQNGFEQLTNSVSITNSASGQPVFDLNVSGGGVITGGALARIPFSKTATEAIGNWLLGVGAGAASTGIGAAVGAVAGALGVVFKQSTGLYIGPGWSISKLTADFTNGEVSYTIPGSSYSFNLLDTPAAGANLGADIAGIFDPDVANNIDSLARPTRTNLAEIIDTPTYVIGGVPEANTSRLALYWDEYLEALPTASPGTDLFTIGKALLTAYNTTNVTDTEKVNISYLWHTPEMEPFKIIMDKMLLDPAAGKIITPPPTIFGNDGLFGVEDLPAMFEFAKNHWGNAGVTSIITRIGWRGLPVLFTTPAGRKCLTAIMPRMLSAFLIYTAPFRLSKPA